MLPLSSCGAFDTGEVGFDTEEVGGREVFPSSLRGCAGLDPASTLFSFSSSSVSFSPSSDVISVIDPTGSISASAPSETALSVIPIISVPLVLSVAKIFSVRLSGGLSVVLILSVILVVVSTASVVVWM